MLYQPTNVYPSLTGALGNGVIDANNDLTVSWQVNGNSQMTAFQIDIFKNDSDSTQLLSTGKLTDNCPFSGTNYKGEVQTFSHKISANVMRWAGIENGGEYKLTIKQWWGTDNAVAQTSASAFITRSTPELQINGFAVPVRTRKYTFYANSYQEQGDALNWVRWQTALYNNGQYEVLDDTGRIYGTSELQYTFDGFFSGNTYAVQCTVQTENGIEKGSGWASVPVYYEVQPINGTLQACGSRLGSGVKLTLPEVKNIPETAGGEYNISNSYIRIDENGGVIWTTVDGNPMNIEPDSESGNLSIAWRGKATSNGTLLEAHGTAFATAFELTDLGESEAYSPYSIRFANGFFIMVAGDGTIWFSVDAENWSKSAITASSYNGWRDVCFADGKYVFVGDTVSGSQKFAISTNLQTFSIGDLPIGCNSVAYGNGVIVAAGAKGICTSSNATQWSTVSGSWTSDTANFSCVCFGGSKFVAVSYDGLIYYSQNGTTWTKAENPWSSPTCENVTYSDGKYLITPKEQIDQILVSNDAITWTPVTLPDRRWALCCVGGDGTLVICVGRGYILHTYDFKNWTKPATPSRAESTSPLNRIGAYGSGRYLIETHNATLNRPEFRYSHMEAQEEYLGFRAETSEISLQSTAEPSFTLSPQLSLCIGNGLYLIGDTSGVFYTEDGTAWTQATMPAKDESAAWKICHGIISGSDTYFASAGTSNAYSFDGKTWTELSLTFKPVAVSFAHDKFFAACDDGIYYSQNALSWSKATITNASNPYDTVAYGNGVYTTITYGSCAYSYDGITWSGVSAPLYTFANVCFGVGTFVAAECNNQNGTKIAYSYDGITWNLTTLSSPRKMAGTVCVGGRFVLPYRSSLDISYDGISWKEAYNVSGAWEAIASSDSQFMVASRLGRNVKISKQIEKQLTVLAHNGSVRSTQIGDSGDLSIFSDGATVYVSSDIAGVKETTELEVPFQWVSANRLAMFGQQESDYVIVGDRDALENSKTKILSDMSYHPNDVQSDFFADFISSTNGGGVGDTGFTDFAIYRQTPGDSVLTHVFDISPEDGNVIIDTSAVPNAPYVYYAYGIGGVSSQAIQSNPVTMCLWDWAVISCTEGEDGTYRPESIFLFGKNLSSGAIGNNNTPNILQNFTQYPTLQPAPWNYRSGTLSSLIGIISDGVYSDTVEMQKRIYALSTTSNELFLKDRKGNLLRIKISGQIEMTTMDNTPQQAQNVKIPWIETGSIEGVKIKLTKNDGAWPY